jgi:8-oxo-dGTP pyrophosphatase MutT (NUDIX family)
MLLRDIEASLRHRLAGTLPGLEAQRRFAPYHVGQDWQAPSNSRAAAALLLLYPDQERVAIPLTLRASHLARHAGQISLPGGATDPGETLAGAALREASEEIGVDPGLVRVLGELTPVHVIVSGFTLHPVVGVADRRPDFRAAPGEVDEVLEVSLDDIRDASRIRRARGSGKASRSNTPTSISTATRCGAPRRWCWGSSSACSLTLASSWQRAVGRRQ